MTQTHHLLCSCHVLRIEPNEGMFNETFKLINFALLKCLKQFKGTILSVLLHMYAIETAVCAVHRCFVLANRSLIVLLSIVMKATKWKTLLEDICQRNDIHMESGSNQNQIHVCLYT